MKTTTLDEIYRDYRGKIDVRRVLEHYGARNVSEVRAGDGTTELQHSCLLDRVEPHHTNSDENPSACANVDKGLYICYAFWAGDIFHLIQKLEGIDTFAGLAPVVSNFITAANLPSIEFQKELDRLFAGQGYGMQLPAYDDRVLDPWRLSHPYMREVRGISHATQTKLGIGFDIAENRIVFPHWWKNRLVGWQKRAVPPSPYWPGTAPQLPKYRNSSGFPRSETLYGYDQAQGNRTVIVVESPMSVAKSHDFGYPITLATFGAKVSPGQVAALREFDTVYVWFDDDAAGRSGCRKLVGDLYRHVEVLVIEPDEGADLADLESADQVQDKLEAALPASVWMSAQSREVR